MAGRYVRSVEADRRRFVNLDAVPLVGCVHGERAGRSLPRRAGDLEEQRARAAAMRVYLGRLRRPRKPSDADVGGGQAHTGMSRLDITYTSSFRC